MEQNVTPPRTQARKAVTRARIITAGNSLFETRGYDATSVEDIAAAAEIATRTIYLHFDSKAAIFLAYVDSWIDSFVELLLARPVDEPIAEAIEAILQGDRSRWTNPTMGTPHPVVEFIGDGPLDIAGHMMHSWVAAQDRIAEDAQRRGNFAPGSFEPRARAATVFAVWMASTLVFREGTQRNGLTEDTNGIQVATGLAGIIGKTMKG